MKKSLKILTSDAVVDGITCFATHAKFDVNCQKTKCNNWICNKEYNNCILIASNDGPRTLQDVGDFFDLTRMRICQIEKIIQDKIKFEE